MCSVVEIGSDNQYYIHYHSMESIDTVGEEVEEEQKKEKEEEEEEEEEEGRDMMENHLMFTNHRDFSLDSLVSWQNNVLVEEITSHSLIDRITLDNFSDEYEIVREVNKVTEDSLNSKNVEVNHNHAEDELDLCDDLQSGNFEDRIRNAQSIAAYEKNVVEEEKFDKIMSIKGESMPPENRIDNLVEGLYFQL